MGLRPFMQLKSPCIMRLALYPYRKLPMYFSNEAKIFGTNIDKDVVRRILTVHYLPGPGNAGPS
jgi:hypothetical protein